MAKAIDNNNQDGDADLKKLAKFDLDEFEHRLAGLRQEFHDELKKSVMYKEPIQDDAALVEAALKILKFEVAAETQPQSRLLAALALEAKQSNQNKASLDKDKHASSLRVHEALERALRFFIPFIQHVNAVEPAISRSYRLDARSIYASLKWKGALVDSRKQSMSDSALLNHVAFNVNLQAPEPVLLKRPWDQFNAVLKELSHLKIRSLDDLEEIHKRPKQEWLEARLDPVLPVQITFQGNYELGKVEVLTRNLADFGQTAFSLEPADISIELLDELGLYLISRSDKLPVLLRDIAK